MSRAILKTLAFNIRKHRLALDMTREELCEKADVSLYVLMRIEAVKSNPGIDLVFRLARALETTPAELFKPPEKA